jgi:hypothetical protein
MRGEKLMLWRPPDKIVEKYKNIRETGRLLNSKVIEVIPKQIIDRTAKEMRLLYKGMLVLDSEDETSYLFDRIIYDVPWDGKSAVEHFEAEGDSQLSEMEKEILQAMKDASFSLFEITGSIPGEYVQLADLLSDNQVELMDINMSFTAHEGTLLATRILNIQDIFMSTGAGFPFGAEHKKTLTSGLKNRQTVRRGKRKRSIRRINFGDPRNYSLYFFRQYKRFGMEVRTSEEF